MYKNENEQTTKFKCKRGWSDRPHARNAHFDTYWQRFVIGGRCNSYVFSWRWVYDYPPIFSMHTRRARQYASVPAPPAGGSLGLNVCCGVLFLLVTYVPFWSGNAGIHHFLMEQQLLPASLSLPNDLHDLWARGELKDTYGVSVAFSDELPFDIIRRVPHEFVSFSIDMEHLLDETRLNFQDERLHRLVVPLFPGVLKVGGRAADSTYYNISAVSQTLPVLVSSDRMKYFKHTLSPRRWEELLKFVDTHRMGTRGLRLYFTLSYGPGNRRDDGSWSNENARQLLEFTKERGYHGVDILGLGHEMNMHYEAHGVLHHPDPGQYVKDIKSARKSFSALLHHTCVVVGQPSVFYPLVGAKWGMFFGFFRQFFFHNGGLSSQAYDFHYYPTHPTSSSSLVGRYSTASRLLDHRVLNEVVYWTQYVERWRKVYSGHSPLWMGGTAFSHGKGEPGLSDAYLGGLWWLDQLGALAAYTDVNMVVRDSLVGPSFNALLDEDMLPRPDYWNTLMWKRIMGTKVYQIESNHEQLRVYAHSMAEGAGFGVSVLLINLDPRKGARTQLQLPPNILPARANKMCLFYTITTPSLVGRTLRMNGIELALDETGGPVEMEPRHLMEMGKNVDCGDEKTPVIVVVPPVSYAFLVVRPGYT